MADLSASNPLPPSERIWSPRQIGVAAFLGGPLAAAWFFSRNFVAFGEEVRARRSLWLGAALAVVGVAVVCLLPARLEGLIPLIPLIYTAAIELIPSSWFKAAYAKHLAEGWVKGSWLLVVGVSVTSLLLTIGIGVTVVLVVARWTGAQVDWDLWPQPAPSLQVTVADLPRILSRVSTASKTPAFAELVFTTPDRPDQRDAVHLRVSVEGGHLGLDWVLLARRNIDDKTSFVGFLTRRGYSFSERAANGVPYIRVENDDLTKLCTDIVVRLYAHPRSEPIGLVAEGFEWNQ